MVDVVDDCFTEWQKIWVDYIDQAPEQIDAHIEKLKQMSGQPWNHPRHNMRWLWDYLLCRKTEIDGIKASQAPARRTE